MMKVKDSSKATDPEFLRKKVETLIKGFKTELQSGELRSKVLALIPIFKGLRNLGKSLIPEQYQSAARDRILQYFRRE
jgi:hypothetical protein